MLSITVNLPDDLAEELRKTGEDYETFIVEALRQRFEQKESRRQYHEECKMSCFAQGEHMKTEDDEDEEWEVH